MWMRVAKENCVHAKLGTRYVAAEDDDSDDYYHGDSGDELDENGKTKSMRATAGGSECGSVEFPDENQGFSSCVLAARAPTRRVYNTAALPHVPAKYGVHVEIKSS